MAEDTVPSRYSNMNTLALEPRVQDERTGALWVHKDYVLVKQPWSDEAHIGPMEATECLGDVESFVEYVKRFTTENSYISWNAKGIRSVIDYYGGEESHRKWIAELPFVHSAEWDAWTKLASGQAVAQRAAVEFLEMWSDDIVEPPATGLLELLRALRANVTSKADTQLRGDGTTAVSFSQDKQVRAGEIDLPPWILIAIPVLKGHVNASGAPIRFELKVRVRASVDSEAKLGLRFSIQSAEKVLETVFLERVQAAKDLLGSEFTVLRAAD